MKDELEVLLENEEELEAELAHVLAHRTFYYYRKNPSPAGEEPGPEPMSAGEEKRELLPDGREAEWAEDLPERRGQIPDARRLYLGLIRARQAAQYRRPGAGQRVALEKESGSSRSLELDAAGMDRIFQRDARRYDGGFTWQ